MQSELNDHTIVASMTPAQFVRSSTPNIRQTESKFVEKSHPPLNSPTFAKKLKYCIDLCSLSKTRDARPNETVNQPDPTQFKRT